MEIIPAIDLQGGQVVRLLRGEYDQKTVYDRRPEEVAKQWQTGGARTIHIVDLDGAKEGYTQNGQAIQAIARAVTVKTELGGGLRDLDAIQRVLAMGVTRAILGSVLLEKPGLAREAARRFPDRIILGIDARKGLVATRGWREDSPVWATDLVREFAGLPIAGVIYTDIARDGTLEGPNLEAIARMAECSPFPLTASGGIGSLDHIRALAALAHSLKQGSITGVIVGKALYEKKFTLEEAIAAAGEIK
ncbi:MAG TPA: 1-(5-phosphoribosyl)-5-[(5-phosphoribosylamino)methylideneamino]imidazole-4-carboxamide isomerase [bacterium]|nr:1-(5-phosphoribosyl)-5-[(5-phosphoribosylamino)methylideneamino]imidazole-4-carboxamide isomerase [Candidatus Omnitrophota bacterium]HOJ61986.1 1-(5-phosphoribosyl)-5-[(5-phosphoribosylamino)methylideneamino]imidazole-4-carboxamide isomerase [bacterium]HOL96135.1 1-(5-phosphoribosyl)-5-[(5-phosphoribosylamino)methylideneamino]imidazole-4-carboxamide isomerase [bacterium]HPP01297.1 1-(5-phosphoribosyl)-5-[(5-phosphoribosylamino)methylideneamino]imidazole-4-carboxamide isomerase [bacterium]HXK